jgi:hypothetical protein
MFFNFVVSILGLVCAWIYLVLASSMHLQLWLLQFQTAFLSSLSSWHFYLGKWQTPIIKYKQVDVQH